MLDTHYVVFVTKIMFSNIILPILSCCICALTDDDDVMRQTILTYGVTEISNWLI